MFSLLLAFTLVGVSLGAEPEPASPPMQAKEPTYEGEDTQRMANRGKGQGPANEKRGRYGSGGTWSDRHSGPR